MTLLRLLVLLVAIVVPGGFLMLFAARLVHRRMNRLDFEGSYRRVPPTRRGLHSPVLL